MKPISHHIQRHNIKYSLLIYLHWLLHASATVLKEAFAHWMCFHPFKRFQ